MGLIIVRFLWRYSSKKFIDYRIYCVIMFSTLKNKVSSFKKMSHS